MPRILTRRALLCCAALTPLGVVAAGCGTILHPERRGQPAGRLDWGIVALDTLGLLLFFLPGVVAFAVDFTTGAIYLPACDCVDASQGRRQGKFVAIEVPRDELTPARIEQIVTEQTQRPVRLAPGAYQTRELQQLDDYWTTRDEMVQG